MRKHLFYWLWVFLPVLSFSQDIPEIDWSKVYGATGADYVADIIQLSDGGFVFISTTNSGEIIGNYENGQDIWIVKTNESGEIIWNKTFGGAGVDTGVRIIETSDENLFIGLNSNSSDGDFSENNGDYDGWIMKIDNSGNEIWKTNIGGNGRDYIFSMNLLSNGGIIIGGESNSSDVDPEFSFTSTSGYVVELDINGNIQWRKKYGGSLVDQIIDIKQKDDGGFIFVADSKSNDGDVLENKGNADYWIVSIDDSGNVIWSKTYGGGSVENVRNVELVQDGYLIAGTSSSSDGDVSNENGRLNDVWVIKINNLGELQWEENYGGNEARHDRAISMTKGTNGFIIIGDSTSTNGDLPGNNGLIDYWVFKINEFGNIVWSQNYGGSHIDNGIIAKLTSDGGYIIGGNTRSNNGDVPDSYGSYDIWIFKLAHDCMIPTIENTTTQTICAGETAQLSVTTEGQIINWYDAVDAETPVFTGNDFTTPELTETTSYWVEVANWGCISERNEVIVTVNPLPELVIEEEEVEICFGNDAHLYAFSEGNVIFWYENEEDEGYLYHGNNFIIEDVTEDTTYWVEAYNVATGCVTERIPVNITVNPAPEAPLVIEVYIAEEGQTLADLEEDIEFEGTLTWYADEFLTVELPNTTPVEDHTVYFVTQTVNDCESEAAVIEVEFLGTFDINISAFAYYPNPVKDNLFFTGKEKVQFVQIFDTTGKLIINKESKANSIQQLDVTALPKGTYLVKAQTDKEVKTFKIIKK